MFSVPFAASQPAREAPQEVDSGRLLLRRLIVGVLRIPVRHD